MRSITHVRVCVRARACVYSVAPSPKCFFVTYTAHKEGRGRKGEGEREADWKREMVNERKRERRRDREMGKQWERENNAG